MSSYVFDSPPPPAEVAALVRKHGIVVIHDFASDLDQLRQEFEALLAVKKSTQWLTVSDYSEGELVRVKRGAMPAKKFPATKTFFSDAWMKEVMQEYWDKQTALFNYNIFVARDVVGSEHVANDLHFDMQNHLKFFLYLKDTTARNGAFACIPQSHTVTAEMRERDGYTRKAYKQRGATRALPLDEVGEEVSIEGATGTLIVFDTDTFHRAGTVTEGERWVMRGHCMLK